MLYESVLSVRMRFSQSVRSRPSSRSILICLPMVLCDRNGKLSVCHCRTERYTHLRAVVHTANLAIAEPVVSLLQQ